MGDVAASVETEPSAVRPRWYKRLARAAASSALATALSQITLIGLLWAGAAPVLASAVAFVVGAVPNYFVSRRWAWGKRGKPPVGRELVPYLAVIAATGVASVGLTTVAGWLVEPLDLPKLWSIVLLDAAFLGSYGVVFLVKFTLLDRIVFVPRDNAEPAGERARQG
jgi:putative flippase GtrA